MTHLVTLNLPATAFGEPPNPEGPIIAIDGKPIEHVIAVSLAVDGRDEAKQRTRVTITFAARVEGAAFVVKSADAADLV